MGCGKVHRVLYHTIRRENVMKAEDEIITIHVDTPEGKTVSKIDVPLSELVKCYMNVHYPLSNNKNVS